jgi:hypothetical protein
MWVMVLVTTAVSALGALAGHFGGPWVGLHAPWWAWALLALGTWLGLVIAWTGASLSGGIRSLYDKLEELQEDVKPSDGVEDDDE